MFRNTQRHDLNQMLVKCLDSADSLALSRVAIKICEAIEQLNRAEAESDDA